MSKANFNEQDFQEFEVIGVPLGPNLHSIVLVTIFTAANDPGVIPTLVKRHLHMIGDDLPSKILYVQMLREALLKASLLCGFPRVINGLTSVLNALPPEVTSALPKSPSRTFQSIADIEQWRARGARFFADVYERHTERVLNHLANASPDLLDMVQTDAYGKILSDIRLLNEAETELVVVAALYPMNVPPQLKSHTHGAINVGASKEQLDATLNLARIICSKVGLSSSL